MARDDHPFSLNRDFRGRNQRRESPEKRTIYRSRSPRCYHESDLCKRCRKSLSPKRPIRKRQRRPFKKPMPFKTNERDQRTLIASQLGQDTRPEHLEEFFSSIGQLRSIKIMTDPITKRSLDIAHIEFWNDEAVPLALWCLDGQELRGSVLKLQRAGSLKLRIKNLDPTITEDIMVSVFEQYGALKASYMEETKAGYLKDVGYVVFENLDDAKTAMNEVAKLGILGNYVQISIVEERGQGFRMKRGNETDSCASKFKSLHINE